MLSGSKWMFCDSHCLFLFLPLFLSSAQSLSQPSDTQHQCREGGWGNQPLSGGKAVCGRCAAVVFGLHCLLFLFNVTFIFLVGN